MLTEITDELYEGVERKEMTSIMTLDQTAAFDCVSHELLLGKLRQYHVGQEVLNWIQDYLTECMQYVEIGMAQSRMTSVLSGVPQGSVIGPLLYAIYTNELTEIVKSPTCQERVHLDTSSLFGKQCKQCGILSIYADDLTYVIGNRQRHRNQSRIRECLDEMSVFLQDNFLVLNLPKTSLTEVMISQKRTQTSGTLPSLVVNNGTEDKLVEDKSYTWILGANLQSNMSWQAHLKTGKKALLPGVRKQLGLLKHIGKLVPKSSWLTLATGLIVSRLG